MKRICLVSLVFLLSTSLTEAASKQPNIVVFLVDDMGVMDTSLPFLTGPKGEPKRYPLNDFYRTPNMERLAERGTRFSQFYAMSVCSPTRSSIMTGQNAARHGTTNWINPEKDNAGPQGPPQWNWEGLKSTDVMLPPLLRTVGYRTIHIGKGHFGAEAAEGANPLNLGFDVNIGGDAFGAPGSYFGEKNYSRKRGKDEDFHAVPHLDKYHATTTFLTEALTIEAKKAVVDAVADEKPFYLYFSHYAVHAPFDSDPRFAAHYKDSGKPANAQAFATLIEGMDKSLGDMLDQFDELGIADNTLVIFLGDNGSDAPLGEAHEVASAAPLRGKKGAHYEGGMRVPFIAAWARVDNNNPAQKRLPIAEHVLQKQIASVCDIFPTLLGVAGIESPQGHKIDGSRLDVLLSGQADDSREQTFLMHYPHAPHRSDYFTVFRKDDWKVIYHYFPTQVSSGSHYQLFNLAKDPFESTDVAAEEPQVLKSMMADLVKELNDDGGLYPVDNHGAEVKPVMPD